MIKKKFLLGIVIFFFSHQILLADIKISVTVNNEIITNHDIKKESNYLEILNPNFNQLNIEQRFNIAKNYLIDQIVKEKEIKKYIKTENDNQQLINDYLKNKINSEDAKSKILKVENVNLAEVDENNVDDVLYYAKEDYNSKRGKEYWGGLKQ